jgi:uncharacterized protein
VPLLESAFQPPIYLRNGHVQTILPALLQRRCRLPWEPERFELDDGDFLDLLWCRGGHRRLALLTHGLEGDTSAGYIRGMAATLRSAGWDVLAWNFRGCGATPNRLLRQYHSGDTADLRLVIDYAARTHESIALVGFSLGGNVTLKYLGEPLPCPAVRAGVAISAPVDLASSARQLDLSAGNRLYVSRFLKTLIAKIEAKARSFPDAVDLTGIRRIRSFQAFDDRYTARLNGFRDAADYWAQSSSRAYLPRITVPTLLLNAVDDPFLPEPCFPRAEAEASTAFHLEAPAYGGHVGFLDLHAGLQPWSERRTAEFLAEAVPEPRSRN